MLNTVSAKQETKDPVGISPVRLGNRTYRTWRIPKLTPMGTPQNRTYRGRKKPNLSPSGARKPQRRWVSLGFPLGVPPMVRVESCVTFQDLGVSVQPIGNTQAKTPTGRYGFFYKPIVWSPYCVNREEMRLLIFCCHLNREIIDFKDCLSGCVPEKTTGPNSVPCSIPKSHNNPIFLFC